MTKSDLVLLAYLFLIVPAMLVGFVFARRKMFVPYHKLTMTTITLVNWALIFLVMLVTYRRDVLPAVPQQLNQLPILIPTLHLLPGLVAQLLATYLVIRMWFENQLPEWFKVKNIKIYMRTTLALWLITALLGVLTWAVVNKGLFAAQSAVTQVDTSKTGVTIIRLVGGNKFEPAELTVNAGTTIQFVNADTRSHTVTADNGSFDSGELKAGATFSHTFTQSGDVPYYCDFHGGKGHEGMSAVIHVSGGSAATESVPSVSTAAATTNPTLAPTTASTTASTASAAATLQATNQVGSTSASVVTVALLDDQFDPKEITIPVGTTIHWENKAKHKHTATADDGSFVSGQLKPGDSFDHKFEKPGDVALYCENHGDKGGVDMAMVIHVSAATTTEAAIAIQTEASAAATAATAAPTLDATLVTAAEPLISRATETPKNIPYIVGLKSQLAILKTQAAQIDVALKEARYEDAQAGAEAVINLLSGGNGKDWDNDGKVQQPGDGYGLQQYIFSINETAGTLQGLTNGTTKAAAADMLAMGQDALKDIRAVNQQAQALIDAKTLVDARKVTITTSVSALAMDISMIAEDAATFGK